MLNLNLTLSKNTVISERFSSLLEEFNKKFEETYEARQKVINYLEWNYDYDSNDSSLIENENALVFGINEEGVTSIINNSERSNA